MKKEDVLDGANNGVVGINEELEVYGGYDDYFREAAAEFEKYDWEDDRDINIMSKDEKIALAGHMIDLWGQYKNKAL